MALKHQQSMVSIMRSASTHFILTNSTSFAFVASLQCSKHRLHQENGGSKAMSDLTTSYSLPPNRTRFTNDDDDKSLLLDAVVRESHDQCEQLKATAEDWMQGLCAHSIRPATVANALTIDACLFLLQECDTLLGQAGKHFLDSMRESTQSAIVCP